MIDVDDRRTGLRTARTRRWGDVRWPKDLRHVLFLCLPNVDSALILLAPPNVTPATVRGPHSVNHLFHAIHAAAFRLLIPVRKSVDDCHIGAVIMLPETGYGIPMSKNPECDCEVSQNESCGWGFGSRRSCFLSLSKRQLPRNQAHPISAHLRPVRFG
jgi:hypothetical protein